MPKKNESFRSKVRRLEKKTRKARKKSFAATKKAISLTKKGIVTTAKIAGSKKTRKKVRSLSQLLVNAGRLQAGQKPLRFR